MARILIADDEEPIRELVKMVLEREGHAVDTADGGRDALDKLRAARYDLAILDRSMPLMTGLEVLREMRRDAALKDVKAIMCTAAGMVSDVDEALTAGAVDYIVKPLDMRALVEKVSRHAAGAPSSDGLLGRLRRLLP